MAMAMSFSVPDQSDMYDVANVSPQLTPMEDKLISLLTEMLKLLLAKSYDCDKHSLYSRTLEFPEIEDVYQRFCQLLRSDPDAEKISFGLKTHSQLTIDIFTKIFDGVRTNISFDGVFQMVKIIRPTMSRCSALQAAYKLHKGISKMKAGRQPVERSSYKPLRLNIRIRAWIEEIWRWRSEYEIMQEAEKKRWKKSKN